MIPFDFEYYKPDTIQEAIILFHQLDSAGKTPVYYGGGTELISMARVGNLSFGSVIDIKSIPECRALEHVSDNLVLGSALTLSDITESKQFPLLDKTAGRIADHTTQCKITLGGNLASTIIYRETILPLLLTDAKVTVAGPSGLTDYKISQIFDQRMNIPKGHFLICTTISKSLIQAPCFHVKKTKNEKVDYPLITTAGLIKDGLIRIAFSGLASYPFRNTDIEDMLNDSNLTFSERADRIANTLSDILLNDLTGSREYRNYVLKNTLTNILETARENNYV